jgi:hypothetical protein
MVTGATLELGLYFRDAEDQRVTVSSITITNTPENFPTHTRLIDYEVHVPAVKGTDVWAGRNIGIYFLSATPRELEGGYWDLDHVRLSATLQPALTEPFLENGQARFTVIGEPGHAVEILVADDLRTPIVSWTQLATVTNVEGRISFTDTTINGQRRFYQARQLPSVTRE